MNPGLFHNGVSGNVNANLYISNVEALGGTITAPDKVKINTLFSDLETNNLYNKIKILYLYHGNASSGALNAINPTDLPGAFKIVWTGTPVFNANGGLIATAGVRGNTQFQADGGGLTFLSGAGMGFYTDETVGANEYSMGVYPDFWYGPTAPGVALSNSFAIVASSNGAGLHFATRESEDNSVKTYYGSTLISTSGPAFNVVFNANNTPVYIGGMLELPATFYEATTDIRLSVFTVGLTVAEVTAMNTCFQTYTS